MGIAISRFDARRVLVVEEANSIGTAYLRAGYLPELYASQSRELPREYAGMFLVAMLGLVMLGFQSGITGKRILIVTLVLVLMFSSVMLLIIALDGSYR